MKTRRPYANAPVPFRPLAGAITALMLTGLLSGCQTLPTQKSQPAQQTPAQQTAETPKRPAYDAPASYPVDEAARPHYDTPPRDMVELLAREFYIANHVEDHPSVLEEVAIYQKYPTRLRNLLERSRPFLYMIYQKVKEQNMPVELVLLPAVESSFNPFARSSQGAAGLWQFTYGTARVEKIPMNRWYDGRLDPEVSTDAALKYLKKLYGLIGEDWLLALASYNAGIGNVRKAIERYRLEHGKPTGYVSFWDIEPYLPRETRRYVPQLMAIARILKDPEAYNIAQLPTIPIKPYLKRLSFEKQISLDRARRYTGLPKAEFDRLNAGYKAAFTPPKGPHKLLLPIPKAQKLALAYQNKPGLLAVPRKHRHTIRFGETLYALARKYGTSVREIRRYNGLKGSRLRVGQTLWIPTRNAHDRDVVVSQNRKRKAGYQRSVPVSKGSSRYYTVRKGDSLWSIARRFGMSTRELARVNRLSTNATLRAGQKLLIPARYAKRQVIHVVRSGDSLWKVARKYGVSEQKVRQWNDLKSATLKPGQKLTIWVAH